MGVPDAQTVQQFHPQTIPTVEGVRRNVQGEEAVLDVRSRLRVVVPEPDVANLDPLLAPPTRAPKVDESYTVRQFDKLADGELLGVRGETVDPKVMPDPLQSMEDAGIRRFNSFRVTPDPSDRDLVR